MVFLPYLNWHYTVAPGEIIGIAGNYLCGTWHRFIIPKHLATLFAPWRRTLPSQLWYKQTIGQKIGNLAMDIIIRFLGAIIRLGVVIIGSLVLALMAILGIASFLLWIVWPFILILACYWGIALLGAGHLILGLLAICTSIGISAFFGELFIESYWKNRSALYDHCAECVLLRAQKTSPTPSSDAIVASLMQEPSAFMLWVRFGIYPKTYMSLFTENTTARDSEYEAFLKKLGDLRGELAVERITASDLLIALFDVNEKLRSLLLKLYVDRDDLIMMRSWFKSSRIEEQKRRKFWTLEHQLAAAPIGIEWTYGNTPMLNRFASDLSMLFRKQSASMRIVGRAEVTDQLERVLSRVGNNNVLLIGEAGVGKETIVLGFAECLARGTITPSLRYKRIMEISISDILSVGTSNQQLGELFNMVFSEARRAGNIIIYIKDFQNITGNAQGLGVLDISEILKPHLGSQRLQVIATTDFASYHATLEQRQDVLKFFEKIDIQEPDEKTTIQILQRFVPYLESTQGVLILYQTVKYAVQVAGKYLQNKPFPEKAIDLLVEVVAYVKTRKGEITTKEDVEHVISSKTHIPLGTISASEKDKIANLQDLMHESIVNQEHAVKQVAETVLRLRAGISSANKPAGSFLFAGPTGVGKTLTAKILAKVYYGSDAQFLRFDMSEYQNPDAVDRFIGSMALEQPSQFLSKVRDMPSAIILLDEIEKAHPKILNLFLQVFDEGILTDAFGKKASFKQNIIIATSNIGAEYVREMVNKNTDLADEKKLFIEYILQNRLLTPELLNRFDGVIIFHPLTQNQAKQIAAMLLRKLSDRLREQSYDFAPSDDLIEYIGHIGYDPQFGARPMQRAVQDTVEVIIARKILNQEIEKGKKFTIGVTELPMVK